MKKIASWIFAFTAFLLIFSTNVPAESYKAGGTCGNDLKWSLDYDGNLYIYGEGEMNDPSWGKYSSEVKTVTVEKGVTSVSNSAFVDFTALTTVQLSDTVQFIGGFAFLRCTSLSKINLPEGITELNTQTFYRCTSLTHIEFPSTMKIIGHQTFGASGLESITIPSNVTLIGTGCFIYCPNLRTVTINGSNLRICSGAFNGCPMLTTVKMGSGVDTIEQDAFNTCPMLTNLTIGENVTAIERTAFNKCTGLREVVIPDKVKVIENWAFSYCTNLEKAVIGRAVTEIGSSAFKNCSSLKEVYFCGAAPAFKSTTTFEGGGLITAYYPSDSKTWDRSNMTSHGAERIDWKSWTLPLDYYTPQLKSVSVVSNGLKVTWAKLNNVAGYEIWRQTGNGSWEKAAALTSGSTTSWTDTKVSNGKRYTYRIYGVNGSQTSKVSNSKYRYYVAPNSITLTRSGSSVIVKWKTNSSATGYQIQRSTSSSFKSCKTTTVKNKKTSSRKLTPGKGKYYFRIRTYKTVNGTRFYSSWSKAKSITIK